MANNYVKNIETFCKAKPFGYLVVQILESVTNTEEDLKVIDGIPCFHENGHFYRMHSENQIREAELLMQDLDMLKDYFLVVYGMGNLTFLRKLVDETSSGTRILVIEKNMHVMKYQFAHENMTELLNSNKFVLCCGADKVLEYVLVACMEANWDNLAQNLKVLSMPNYVVYEEFRTESLKKITKSVLMEISSLGNSLPDIMNGLNNQYKNVDACTFSNGIGEVRGKFKGVPGIVVSAGPSLDKNLDLLKEAEGKAVIISTDAAYRACRRIGVHPDAIASIERDKPTYDYFYKDQEFDKDMVLVAPSLLWPDIFKEYPGKKMLMSKTIAGVDGWWGSFFPQMEHLLMGFSCSNVAHAVLDEMGCNPIIVIGQDFAYTDNKRHSEDSKYHKTNEVEQMKKEDGKGIWVEDINGEWVRTSEVFNMFRHSMEDRIVASDKTLIDATEGGAKIKGSKIMTFREAIDTYCQGKKEKSINDCLEEKTFDKALAKEKYKEIIDSVDLILQDLDDIEHKIASHCEVINKYDNFDFEAASLQELIDVVKVLQEGNSFVDFIIKEKKNLVTFYQQNLKQTIIYVKKIGNDVTPKSVKRNWELQEHLMYLMEIATKLARSKYKEVRAYIEEKIKEVEVAE